MAPGFEIFAARGPVRGRFRPPPSPRAEAPAGAGALRHGRVCETYPDPAIRRLGLWPPAVGARASYKGNARALRASILGALADAAPWLRLSPAHRGACIESGDCLDALVCALVARAVVKGLTDGPPAELAAQARSEGWIHLPAPGAALHDLV